MNVIFPYGFYDYTSFYIQIPRPSIQFHLHRNGSF